MTASERNERSHHGEAPGPDCSTAERLPGPDWLADAGSGPRLRSNMITVYIYRRPAGTADVSKTEFLQMRRTQSRASFMSGTWQPVSGGIESGETAVHAAFREAFEETQLRVDAVIAAWHIDQVRPFFIPSKDLVMMPASFGFEVASDWEPVLNDEHDAVRWVPFSELQAMFMWRGQVLAIQDLMHDVLEPRAIGCDHLRLHQDLIVHAARSIHGPSM